MSSRGVAIFSQPQIPEAFTYTIRIIIRTNEYIPMQELRIIII